MSRILRLLMMALSMLASIQSDSSAEDEPIDETKWLTPLENDRTIEAPGVVKQGPSLNPIEDNDGSNASIHELTEPEKILEPSETEPLSEVVEEEITSRPYNASGWYRSPHWDSTTWRPGWGDRFGDLSFESVSSEPVEEWEGLSFTYGHGFHFLTGPTRTDMPPRVFDFHWGLHYFGEISDRLWVDLSFSAGLYTDFEDSVRDGWRFPSHAVFSWEHSPEVQPVLGLRFFDRDNLGLLPVTGLIFRPDDNIRIELVYPEPKIAWLVSEGVATENWISLSGRIGGGEWAIERHRSGLADVVTYNDYQIVLAFDSVDGANSVTSFEIGYVFKRKLKYRSRRGNFNPPETMFLRMVFRK